MTKTTTSRFLALMFMSLAAACGDDASNRDAGGGDPDGGGPGTVPTVSSSSPASGATDVPLNGNVRVIFSEAMDRDSFTAASFTVTTGNPATPVAGTIIADDLMVTFWPADFFAVDTTFTATVTTAATSASGVALASDHEWTFTTGDSQAPGIPVELGTSGDFAILAKSGISTVPPSAIVGDLGVSPAAASFITGFSLTMDASNVFSISPQVTGQIFAADYAPPTPSNLTTAVSDMELAFTDAASRAPDVTELGAGNIGGMTLTPGVYKWGTGLLIPSNITLDGSATDVWIFQIAQDLTVSSDVSVGMSGGALPANVFWQVAGKVELGTTSHVEGVILTMTSITLETGASVNGRLLAQTAVTIDASTIVAPQ